MAQAEHNSDPDRRRNLYVFNLGLLFFRRARHILEAHGFAVRFGFPNQPNDLIGVWGRKKTSKRGRAIAKRKNLPLLTIEDSFLRSVRTGRQGAPSLGVVCDKTGIFFDATGPNDLAALIKSSAGIPQTEFDRATRGIAALKENQLSKYNAFEMDDPDLPFDYVLVVDQTVGDASVRLGGASRETFDRMLQAAMNDHPGVRILVKVHPETNAGKRSGYFGKSNTSDLVQLYDKPVSPWVLMDRARAVYTVTSQFGLEAIFAGLRPVVFGKPFYAGWGLSDDRHPELEQKGWRKAEHLFWAAYLKYTLWYDPFFKRKSTFHRTVNVVSAQAENWRDGSRGAVLLGMRLWKRGFLRTMLGQSGKKMRFAKSLPEALEFAVRLKAPLYAWGRTGGEELRDRADITGVDLVTVEDGFVRSQGLGAELVRPCSLVFDRAGIYYDPSVPSDLENMIAASPELPIHELERAGALRHQFCRAGLSKYNLGGKSRELPAKEGQKTVLVVGQVEDDASVQLGCADICTNRDLLWAARQAFPKAFIVYKPHPDVEAGLREGAVSVEILRATANGVARKRDITGLIKSCDVVCTMTSLAGFEALMHGKEVVCFGTPFYAGWGLTDDRGESLERRSARPTLDQLTHACLIGYPRYWDPISGEPCPAETVFERFEKGEFGPKGTMKTRILAKLQGVLANYNFLWR
jgi:capsular polysaccharide export protein